MPANDNTRRSDSSEGWKMWLQLIAIWALPPLLVMAGMIATVVFL
jgi:hypothetical protein